MKLQVMKFGGTSVGDAACIARAARIVTDAQRESAVVAGVSAMSGVTNRLVEAAKRAGEGDREQGSILIGELRKQHAEALAAIVSNQARRIDVTAAMNEILAEGGGGRAGWDFEFGGALVRADLRGRSCGAGREEPCDCRDGTDCDRYFSRWRGTA